MFNKLSISSFSSMSSTSKHLKAPQKHLKAPQASQASQSTSSTSSISKHLKQAHSTEYQEPFRGMAGRPPHLYDRTCWLLHLLYASALQASSGAVSRLRAVTVLHSLDGIIRGEPVTVGWNAARPDLAVLCGAPHRQPTPAPDRIDMKTCTNIVLVFSALQMHEEAERKKRK